MVPLTPTMVVFRLVRGEVSSGMMSLTDLPAATASWIWLSAGEEGRLAGY